MAGYVDVALLAFVLSFWTDTVKLGADIPKAAYPA
jgi:hypothetical protein